MKTIRETHELRKLILAGVAALAIGAVTGSIVGLSATQWLALALGTSLVLWVGGAVSGQLILARIIDRGTNQQVLDFNRQLLTVIPAFYVPMSVVALGCGIAMIAIHGVPFWSTTVIIPLALYLMTTIAGTAISAPGYTRLLKFADANGADHPDIRRRLLPLAWVNRIELTLLIGLGFTILASTIH